MATANFTSSINLNNGTITLTDASDFVSQGIALIDVNGNFKITAPNGSVIYENISYYFEADTAQGGSTTTIQLATTATTLPLAGYYLLATGGAGAGQAPKIATYNPSSKLATFTAPVGVAFDNTTTYRIVLSDIFIAANLNNQQPISLMVNGVTQQGTYTIDYFVYNSDTGDTYTSQSTVDYVYTLPTVTIAQTTNCVQGIFASIDTTNYQLYGGVAPTSLTRTHTIYYPPTLGIPDVVGSTANLYAPSLYNNGTYTTGISTVVSWVVNGVTITATLTGTKEKTVECAWVCELACCIKSMYNNWQRYITTNTTLAAQYEERWLQGIGLLAMINNDATCFSGEDINNYISVFRATTDCNSGCGCDNQTISLVPTIASIINTYDVTSLSPNWLTVNPVVSGVSTTFELQLTNAAITALTAGNTVTADTNTKVTVTGSGNSASFAVKGATVSDGSGIDAVFSGGTTNPDYNINLANLLLSDFNDNATTGTTIEQLKAYTVLGGTMLQGDRLRVKALFSVTPNTDSKIVAVRVNTTNVFSTLNANQAAIAFVYFDYDLYCQSATSLKVMVNKVATLNSAGGEIYSFNNLPTTSITCNNLTTNTNTVNVTGDGSVAGDIISKDLSIEYLGRK